MEDVDDRLRHIHQLRAGRLKIFGPSFIGIEVSRIRGHIQDKWRAIYMEMEPTPRGLLSDNLVCSIIFP